MECANVSILGSRVCCWCRADSERTRKSWLALIWVAAMAIGMPGSNAWGEQADVSPPVLPDGIGTPAALGSGQLLSLVGSLVLIVVLIFALAWLMRRFTGFSGTADGHLQILGGLAVGQRERVVLLKVGNRQLLLGVAPGRVNTLQVLDEPLITASRATAEGESFAVRLKDVIRAGRS